jgi:hypothetical protein
MNAYLIGGLVVVLLLAGTISAQRMGYRLGRNTVVRCRRGHLFTTMWIPGVSLKAVRLGRWRLQRCPVGPHWALVAPVRDSDLSEAERALAASNRDVRIP